MTEPSPEPCHPHNVDGGVAIGATGKVVELNTAISSSPSSSSKKSTAAALEEAKKTIANIQKLSLLETITMHRFRHGGDSDDPVLIRELEFFLQRSLSKGGPFLCKTDLYGPDTLHIARNTAALEYLKGLGFIKVTEEFERKAERVVYDVVPERSGLGAAAVNALSSTSDPKAREDAFYATSTEDGIATMADDEKGSPGTPGSTCTTATSITTKNTALIGHRHYLQLASVPAENSAEWQHFKQSVTKALAELEKARNMNCGLLRVMLHRFIFFHNMATEYRVEIVAKEADPYATLLLQEATRREPSSKPPSAAPSAATTPSGAAKRGNAVDDDGGENEGHADIDPTDVDPEFAAALAAAKRAVQIKKGNNSGTSTNEDGFVVLPDPSAATNPQQQQQQQRTAVSKPRSASAGPLVEETHISQYFSLDDATVLPSLIGSTANPSSSSTSAKAPAATGATVRDSSFSSTAAAAAAVNASPSVYGTLSPSAAGSSLSSPAVAAATASGPSSRSLPPPPTQMPAGASGAPQTQLTLFQNMMASFDLKKICGPCTVDINVYRTRTIRGDKLKAVGALGYDSSAPLRREVDLKDPRAPAGLPVGRITVEIDSVRLRYYTLKALEHFVEKHTSGEEEGEKENDDAVLDENTEGMNNSDDEESGNTSTGRAATTTSAAPWIEQQAIIEAAARRLRSGARSEPSTAVVEAHLSEEGGIEATTANGGPSAAAATSLTPQTLPRGGDDHHTTAAIGVGGVITGGDYTVGKYDADDYF